jgi:hypothetical protein
MSDIMPALKSRSGSLWFDLPEAHSVFTRVHVDLRQSVSVASIAATRPLTPGSAARLSPPLCLTQRRDANLGHIATQELQHASPTRSD